MRRNILLTVFMLVIALTCNAQHGQIDPTFNPSDLVYGEWLNSGVQTTAIQSDGKILIGGSFSSTNEMAINGIARLNTNGSLDTTFNTGSGANSAVLTTAIQSDGKILIGGDFVSFNGIAIVGIARLNEDGSLDTTFNPGTGAIGSVNSIAIQNDGKIVIGAWSIARLNTDGSLDTTFNIGLTANNFVGTISIQGDGKIVIGGNFTSYNGTTINRIARLNTDGSLDTTFNIGLGANDYVYSTSIQSDGKILIGGDFTSYNGTTLNRIVRLNTDGSLDITFNTGTGTNYSIYTTAIQNDGKILIGGSFGSYNGLFQRGLARLNTDGSKDTTFSVYGSYGGTVYTTAIQSDGRIIIGGYFSSFNETAINKLARLETDGSVDIIFNPATGANSYVNLTAIQSDGKILIVGGFSSYNETAINTIARLNIDGGLDTTFNAGIGTAGGNVSTAALQNDGKILIGGDFSSYNGTAINTIARLNTNGSLDTTFNPGTGAAPYGVKEITVQSDGKIIIVGGFTNYNGVSINRIARLNTDGSFDTSFNPGTGTNNYIYGSAIQSDGKILIAGNFTTFNGTARDHIARLNADGSLDSTFNPGTGANAFVRETVIQSDGKILFWGNFTSFNGTAINKLARLNTDGSLDATFNPGNGPAGDISTAAIQNDGKIVIGGEFYLYNFINRSNIARINSDGSLDNTFNDGAQYGTSGGVYTTAIQNDGKIIIGGDFDSYNGQVKKRVARILGCTDYSFSETSVICEGDTYNWHGTDYYITGVYQDTYNTINGCDSIYQLDLIVNSVNTAVTVAGASISANLIADAYQWLDCNNSNAAMIGETGQSFTASTSGDYAVEITKDACTDTSDCITISTVGINENKFFDSVSIFPNPTDGHVNIDFENVKQVSIQVYSTMGELIYQKEDITGASHQFELNTAPGFYIIEISSQGEKQKYKMMKI